MKTESLWGRGTDRPWKYRAVRLPHSGADGPTRATKGLHFSLASSIAGGHRRGMRNW